MRATTMTTNIPITTVPDAPLGGPVRGYAPQLTAPATDGKKPSALYHDAQAPIPNDRSRFPGDWLRFPDP